MKCKPTFFFWFLVYLKYIPKFRSNFVTNLKPGSISTKNCSFLSKNVFQVEKLNLLARVSYGRQKCEWIAHSKAMR